MGILGASTTLGKELLEWLDKWRFPCTPFLFDDAQKGGEILHYRDHYLPIHAWDHKRIAECDVLFDCRLKHSFSLENLCKEHAYIITMDVHAQGKFLLPSIHMEDLADQDHTLIIPQASFCLLAPMLSLMHQKAMVKQVQLTSLHSVSELGDSACNDLKQQLHSYETGQAIESQLFPLEEAQQHLPLLFQALPQTAKLNAQGFSEEEALLKQQCEKMHNWEGNLSATCVRIAGLRGLSMSVTFVCEQALNCDTMIDHFSMNPSFICYDDVSHNMYPICADVIHDHRIYIGRMRQSDPHIFMAWAVCDDMAIRAAAAVKLAFYLLHNYL